MKKPYRYFIEILVLVTTITAIVCCFFGENIIAYFNSPEYSLSFNDVDGLQPGSQVKMLGVNIGFITSISTESNKVLIKFKINNKRIAMPKYFSAGIESSGMAGSKYVTLMPETQKSKTYIYDPVRINDLFHSQTVILQSIYNSSKTALAALGSGPAEKQIANIKLAKRTVKSISSQTSTISNSLKQSNSKHKDSYLQTEKTINDADKSLKELNSATNISKDTMKSSIDILDTNSRNFSTEDTKENFKNSLSALNENLTTASEGMKKASIALKKDKVTQNIEKLKDNTDKLNLSLKTIESKLNLKENNKGN